MICFASTYPSGLGSKIEKWIKQEFNDVNIVFNFDGLIVYKTNCEFKKVPFFNNTFIVLAYSKCKGKDFEFDTLNLINRKSFDFESISKILNNLNLKRKNNNTFKILTLDKNQPTKIDYKILKPIEKEIEKTTGLKLGEKQHDFDFIINRRSENIILFMFKLTYDRKTEKNLAQGSLRPEIANIMCKLAEINENDICMDMFCGSGAIPKEIIKNFKYNMVFASDNDTEKINKLKKEFKNNNKKLYIKERDALNLDYFEDGFIDKIITDPPWNIYNKQNEDFTQFYVRFLNESNRILKPTGKAVILMGNITPFENALELVNDLKKTEEFSVLINGKKAKIYVLKKSD